VTFVGDIQESLRGSLLKLVALREGLHSSWDPGALASVQEEAVSVRVVETLNTYQHAVY
jgi:hypothetical protein